MNSNANVHYWYDEVSQAPQTNYFIFSKFIPENAIHPVPTPGQWDLPSSL